MMKKEKKQKAFSCQLQKSKNYQERVKKKFNKLKLKQSKALRVLMVETLIDQEVKMPSSRGNLEVRIQGANKRKHKIGVTLNSIADTGATPTVISQNLAKRMKINKAHMSTPEFQLNDAMGKSLQVIGVIDIHI